jgi:type II secretory pathway predicted ATPase ExeA
MYLDFYGLDADPFRLSPDHNFCYRYPSFSKGRAYMQYALHAAEGFVVVTGQPGMGKTTLIGDLLSDYGPGDYTVATLVNTMLEANEVLRSTAYEFGLNVETMDTATVLQRLKQLFAQTHQSGRPPLLVVDEAQNLTLNALEELRMLTNLQANGKPLLQIFLVGQEELRAKLQDPSLEQLRQRVTAAAHLHPLNQDQTAAYIIHRLKVVGWRGSPKIKASVLPVIEQACEGVPRRINQFCSRLLLHGAVEQKTELDGGDARVVYGELADEHLSTSPVAASTGLASASVAGGQDIDALATADQYIHETPEAAGRDKVVVPPPPKPSSTAVAPAAPEIPPPAAAEASPAMRPDATERAAAQRYGQSPVPPRPSTSAPAYPMHTPLEARYRSPARPVLAVLMFFLLIAGAGALAWFQIDRQAYERLLEEEVDFYLERLRNDPETPATETPPAQQLLSSGGDIAEESAAGTGISDR